jgi:hypothetical protein
MQACEVPDTVDGKRPSLAENITSAVKKRGS